MNWQLSNLIILVNHGLKFSVCFYHLSCFISKVYVQAFLFASLWSWDKPKILTDFGDCLISEFDLLLVLIDLSLVIIEVLFAIWRIVFVLLYSLDEHHHTGFKVSLFSFPSVWCLVLFFRDLSEFLFLNLSFHFKSVFLCFDVLHIHKYFSVFVLKPSKLFVCYIQFFSHVHCFCLHLSILNFEVLKLHHMNFPFFQ